MSKAIALVSVILIMLVACAPPEATPPPPTAFPEGATPGLQPEIVVVDPGPGPLEKGISGFITVIVIALILVALGGLALLVYKFLTHPSVQKWLFNNTETLAERQGEQDAMQAEASALMPIVRADTQRVDEKMRHMQRQLAIIQAKRGAAQVHLDTVHAVAGDLVQLVILVATKTEALEDHLTRLTDLRDAIRDGDRNSAAEAAGMTADKELIHLVTHGSSAIYTPQLTEMLSSQIGFTRGQQRTLKRMVGGWVQALSAIRVEMLRLEDTIMIGSAVKPFAEVYAELDAAATKLGYELDDVGAYTVSGYIPDNQSATLAVEAAEQAWTEAQ